ncbi:MAG: hypothetical protein ACO3IV_06800 [Ilumatobacteraceae bacterium]
MSAAAARARAYRMAAGDAAPSRQTLSQQASSRNVRPATMATPSTGYLRLVPPVQHTPRVRVAPRVSLLFVFMVVGVIMVVIFQAMIAEQQLRLDAVSKDLQLAEYNYEDLRQERAELLAPNRLRYEAMMLGMYQGLSTKFVEVPADIVAAVAAATGKMDPQLAEPLPGTRSAVDVVNGIADPNALFVTPPDEESAP